jgi:hypothetical protein
MAASGRRVTRYREERQERQVESQRLERVREIERRRECEIKLLLLERAKFGFSPEWSDFRLQYGHRNPLIASIDLK